jgi:pantothenate kinase
MHSREPLGQPVSHLLSLFAADGERQLIALAGLPGSGKSTLAVQTANDVNKITGSKAMIALGMDGFHLSKAELKTMPDPDEAFKRRGAPWTFSPTKLAARLQQLKSGAGHADLPWPGFEHGRGDPVEAALTVGADTQIVLVEGLYLLYRGESWKQVANAFDERWYLDTPMELSMERLAARHMATRSISRAAAEDRIAENDRLNAEIVLSTRNFAHYLVECRSSAL